MRRPRTKRKVRARAFIIVALILSPVLQARPQECGNPTPPHCKEDCTGKKFYHEVSNKTGNANTCQPCTAECGPGFNLIGTCGGSEGSDSSCEPQCTQGSFCDQKSDQCTGCGICDHTVGDVLCNATHDTICGPCRPGFFHLKDYPGLCHSCDLLSNQQSEPQCQKGLASTTTSFLDTTSTGTSPMITQQDFTSAAKVERTTLMIQMVHSDKSSHLEWSFTESSVVEEPVPEDDQVDESESTLYRHFLHVTLNLYIFGSFCILVPLLLLVTFYIRKRSSDRRMQRRQKQRQAQRQNYKGYAQQCMEEGASDDDANCMEGTVSLNVLNDTAQYQRTTCPHSPASGTSLNQGSLSTRSHSHSHLKIHLEKTFQELPDEMKPLMTENVSSTDDPLNRKENEKSLDREENQQCPSLQNLASNDGTNLGDSDEVSMDEKRCTAKPELEATVCVPRKIQTEPVSDMLPSNSSASADDFRTSGNVCSAARISTSDDKSSTPKAAEPGTTSCKQGEMQTMHPEVPDTQAMQWKILGMLNTVVTSAFGKSSTEKSPVGLSANQEAPAACSPEKKSETKKLGDGSESDGPDRMSSAVPLAISTPESKCMRVDCSGNYNNIFVMNNSQ